MPCSDWVSDKQKYVKTKPIVLHLFLCKDDKQAQVQSLEAPRFEEPLRDCTVCAGSDAAFKGVITGSQPMSISWLYNGKRHVGDFVLYSSPGYCNFYSNLTI